MSIRQFSLLDLSLLIGGVCLYLGMRGLLFTPSTIVTMEAGTAIRIAHLMPPLFACLAVAAFRIRNPSAGLHLPILLGFFSAALIAAALAIEFAEGFRRMRYWNWFTDYPTFLAIVMVHAAIGGTIGLVIGWLGRLRRSAGH
jgi:hypothetical protein